MPIAPTLNDRLILVRRRRSPSTCGSSSHSELSSSSCCYPAQWPATSHSASSEPETYCASQTSGSPPSAPPSSPSPVLLSSSGASGTSSTQARALSPLSIPHASLLSEVCIDSPATLVTPTPSPSSSRRRGSSGASVWLSTHF